MVFAFTQARKDREHLFNIVSNPCRVGADVSPHLQVFNNGHAGKDPAPFRHHRQSLSDQIPGALPGNAFAQVFDVAGIQRLRACDGFHGRCFARTVGADQRHQLAFVDFKVDSLDSLNAAISHFQAFDFQQRWAHVSVLPCPNRPQSLCHFFELRQVFLGQSACHNRAR